MVIKETGLNGKEALLVDMDTYMHDLGFVRWAWDYQHATYDYKLVEKGTTYYLRIQANAVEGRLEESHALLRLDEPFMGKHIFPHGVDYDAPIPDNVLKNARAKLQALGEKLANH
ncbi:MAG: YugN family protein [Clostridia bacterium]